LTGPRKRREREQLAATCQVEVLGRPAPRSRVFSSGDECRARRAVAVKRSRDRRHAGFILIARQLRDIWEAGKPGHEKQITARQNALDTCKSSRP
jgi:hypothetical protein